VCEPQLIPIVLRSVGTFTGNFSFLEILSPTNRIPFSETAKQTLFSKRGKIINIETDLFNAQN
jgi:hypothetical protein